MDEEKRTATDILLSVESRLTTLEKRIQNSENLLKILLGRLNVIMASGSVGQKPNESISPSISVSNETKIPGIPSIPNPNKIPFQASVAEPKVVNKDNFENRPKTSKFTEAAASYGIEIDDEQDQDPQESQESKYPKEDDLVASPGRANSRGQRGPKNNTPKVSVSQIVRNENNDPLLLANVEVFDSNGSFINQTRTNTKGRWLLALAPGDYQVHILKRSASDPGKDPIETMYPITVPPVDKPLELDPLNVGNP